jgi:hypothetical protein
MTETQLIDLDLVDQTIALIPEQAWTHVRQVIVTALVDNMPGSVVERLTGSYDAFDQAEQILFDYYDLPQKKHELIIDSFKIMGSGNALELLDAAGLDQFIDHDIPTHQSSAVSTMQGESTQDN